MIEERFYNFMFEFFHYIENILIFDGNFKYIMN